MDLFAHRLGARIKHGFVSFCSYDEGASAYLGCSQETSAFDGPARLVLHGDRKRIDASSPINDRSTLPLQNRLSASIQINRSADFLMAFTVKRKSYSTEYV